MQRLADFSGFIDVAQIPSRLAGAASLKHDRANEGARGSRALDEPSLNSEFYHLGDTPAFQFDHHVAAMDFDRPRADAETVRNYLVRLPPNDASEHVALAGSKRGEFG